MNIIILNEVAISRKFNELKLAQYKSIVSMSSVIRDSIGKNRFNNKIDKDLLKLCSNMIQTEYGKKIKKMPASTHQLLLLNTLIKTDDFMDELVLTNPSIKKLLNLKDIIEQKKYSEFHILCQLFNASALRDVYLEGDDLSILINKIMELLVFKQDKLTNKIKNNKDMIYTVSELEKNFENKQLEHTFLPKKYI